MISTRKEGFIIRKSRILGEDQLRQQKRHMSQTQFYRKGGLSSARTPGLIIHVKHKMNGHLFNSDLHEIYRHQYQSGQHNPEHWPNTQKLKYEYEQNASDLKQKGQIQNNNINDKSFEQLHTQISYPTPVDIKIQQNSRLLKILNKLCHQLQNRTHGVQILQAIKSYIQLVGSAQTSYVDKMHTSLLHKKLLKQSIVRERYGILLIGLTQVLQGFDKYKSYLINIANYAVDNILMRLTLLTHGKDKNVIQLLKQYNKQKLLNKSFDTIKTNNQILLANMNQLIKIDNAFHEAYKKLIKLNKTLQVNIQFAAIQQFIAYYLCQINKAEVAPFLSVAPAPYLSPQQFQKYTLVIDVVECLCTKNKKAVQAFRPFAEYFLDQMSQYYEIVSFSNAMPDQINRVITLLDRKKLIKHRLFRHHIDKSKGSHYKDLNRLGRDLNKIILVDTNKSPNNANTILVSEWKGKKNDAQLAQLCPILAMIVIKKLNPVKAIKKLQEKNEQNMKIGFKHLNCGINLQ